MIGAYQSVHAFARPGWRLTIPGGPAGGHYKGFTHNYSKGTGVGQDQDQYEADRAAGVAAHDLVHASPRSPRGVYRGPAEVPPRPNASGSAMTYRGYQTERRAGTSVAPGSFPAPFYDTPEDAFLDAPTPASQEALHGMGNILPAYFVGSRSWGMIDSSTGLPVGDPQSELMFAPGFGPTSVVNQPPPSDQPAPAPIVPVYYAPPISPQPGPTVLVNPSTFMLPANQTAPTQAGSTVPAPGSSWLTSQSLVAGYPNWAVAGAGALALFLLTGGGKGKR